MNHYMSQLWNDERLFIIALDKDGKVTYANPKTQELFCNPAGGLMGEEWIETAVLPENRLEARTRLQRMMAGKMDQLSQVGDMDVVTRDGTRLRILWNNHLLHDSGGKITGMLSFGQDITEQKRVQFRLGLHQKVAKIIGESSTFTQAAETFIRTICERFDWDFGEVWIHEKNRNVMVWHNCWNQGDADYSDFRELSRGLVFAKGKGLPGVVWEHGKPMWIETIADHPGFLRREEARKNGLRSAFGLPLRVGGEVVGIVAFMSRRIQPPDEGLIELFDSASMQLGNFYRRRIAEARLQIWDELFRSSGEAMMVTDAEHRILVVNEAFSRMTGYDADEVTGQTPAFLQSGRQERSFYLELLAVLNDAGYWQGEIWNRRKDGTEYLQGLTISRIRNEQGMTTHYIATFSDNSERKAAEERIRYLVQHDPLTGLPNRTLLFDRINTAIARAKRSKRHVVVFSIDVDRFKVVNDSLGHDVGDMLLQEMAQRLQTCVREEDTLSRPGGDEFAIVFPNVEDIGAVAPIAEKVAACMRTPISISDMDFSLTASIGISVYPGDGTEKESLLKNADAAMNYAKETGRNRYHFFTNDLNRMVSERLRIETNLRKALERNEFVLYYQPQVDLHSNRVVGMEALIRWRQPEEGLISPAKFIPMAEESGLIVPIGEWILATAAGQWRDWTKAGMPPVSLAVNISAVQFYQSDFLEKISRHVKQCRLESFLEIEVTEGVMMRNVPATLDIMHKLKAIGCKLSIDDFGTGYSSLGYLSRFPLDKLKIDQSFVRAMLTSQTNMAIVDTIIRLANNLHLRVIAEGVETDEEMEALRDRKCDEVQGYLYARPMPAEELILWWKKWNLEHGV